MMKQGRLGYNSSNGRYGLLSSDLWIDTGFHCGEGLEVLVGDEWVQTRMKMNLAREWYLVGTPYCGNLGLSPLSWMPDNFQAVLRSVQNYFQTDRTAPDPLQADNIPNSKYNYNISMAVPHCPRNRYIHSLS